MTIKFAVTAAKAKTKGPVIPPTGGSGGGGDWNGGGGSERLPSLATYRLGMCLALASITMMFIGLSSAYIVREGLDPNWRAIPLPPLLLVTTAVLLASSLTLEWGRRSFRRGLDSSTDVLCKWLGATLLLGLTFLGGQLMAWRLFFAQGIYLNTNAHGSFIYLMSGLHGLHVVGGILALGYFVMTLWFNQSFAAGASIGSPAGAFSLSRVERWLEATAIYWHFMGGLWIYLLVLLFVVR